MQGAMRSFKLGVPVLLLVLATLLQLFSSGAAGVPHQLAPSGRRLLAEEEEANEYSVWQSSDDLPGLTFNMLHRDHIDSPLRKAGAEDLSRADRLKDAVSRSKQRTKSIRSKIKLLDNEANSRRDAQLLGVRTLSFSQQGEFIVYLSLGTPPKNMTAIVDSGSDLPWVQCAPCSNCISQPDPYFNPTKSSSYATLPCMNPYCKALPKPWVTCSGNTCPYQYQYGDGTLSNGQFSTETITLGSTNGGTRSITNFAFGCGTKNSGDLAGADGIVGIGRGSFSMPTQLGAVLGYKFSFCLVSMDLATYTTSPLIIGNDSFAAASGSSWTPLVKNTRNPTFYYVQVLGIKLDGQVLSGIPAKTFDMDSRGNGGTILDTGTTITELLPAAYNVLLAALRAKVKYPEANADDYGFDICWDTSSESALGQDPTFPQISLQLTWTDFPIQNDNAYITVNYNVQCLSFSSGLGFNIIGNVHLQNTFMFFNNDNKVVGFKPAQCDQV